MIDFSEKAEPFRDIDPNGKMAHELPHHFLQDKPNRGPNPIEDCCQFTAGKQRCQGDYWTHRRMWPHLYHPEMYQWTDPCPDLIREMDAFYDDPMTEYSGMGGEMSPLVEQGHIRRHNCQGMGEN